MLKKQFNTLFGIAVSASINVFFASSALAIDVTDPASCADAWPVWLESKQAAHVDPGGAAVRVHVPSDGYLLAESYTLEAGGEPQVVIDGVADIGADWLSGRLLPVQAGTYCIRVTSQSSQKPLGDARLTLAFAEPKPTGLLKNGDDPPPEEEEEPIVEEPAGGIMARTAALTGYSSIVPFDRAGSETKNGDGGTEEEEEEPIVEEPAGGIMMTSGGILSTASLQKNGDDEPTEEEEEPIVEEPAGGIMVRGNVAQVDPAALAFQLGLCEGMSSDWGSLACSKKMALNGWLDISGEASLETYTFTLERRASIEWLTEGTVGHMEMFDERGRLIETDEESRRTLSAGRYLVRVFPSGSEPYSLALVASNR